MKITTTKAMVLRRVNYGEADRVVTFLTESGEKLAALAKGSRKSTSKLAGGIELLSESEVGLAQGKGELYTLTSSKLVTHFAGLTTNLELLQLAYDLLKRVDRVAEYTEEPSLYRILRASLQALDSNTDPALVQIWFDMQLLKLLGHSPNLRTDDESNPLRADGTYHFTLDRMAFALHPEGTHDARHIKLLRLAIGVDDIRKLAQVSGMGDITGEVLLLSRTMSKTHIPVA